MSLPESRMRNDLQTRRFALRYPTFSTDEVVSTTVPRVIDSAYFFSQGFFGREAEDITYLTTADFEDPVSWLVPWESCSKPPYAGPARVSTTQWLVCPAALLTVVYVQAAQDWAERYIPHIAKRLNELVPGVGFSFNTTQGALYACPYDLAARNLSPWCNVFKAHELKGLE